LNSSEKRNGRENPAFFGMNSAAEMIWFMHQNAFLRETESGKTKTPPGSRRLRGRRFVYLHGKGGYTYEMTKLPVHSSLICPPRMATARRLCVPALSVIGPVYRRESAVGAVPSNV